MKMIFFEELISSFLFQFLDFSQQIFVSQSQSNLIDFHSLFFASREARSRWSHFPFSDFVLPSLASHELEETMRFGGTETPAKKNERF
jgi:hypothetical protein